MKSIRKVAQDLVAAFDDYVPDDPYEILGAITVMMENIQSSDALQLSHLSSGLYQLAVDGDAKTRRAAKRIEQAITRFNEAVESTRVEARAAEQAFRQSLADEGEEW